MCLSQIYETVRFVLIKPTLFMIVVTFTTCELLKPYVNCSHAREQYHTTSIFRKCYYLFLLPLRFSPDFRSLLSEVSRPFIPVVRPLFSVFFFSPISHPFRPDVFLYFRIFLPVFLQLTVSFFQDFRSRFPGLSSFFSDLSFSPKSF